MRQPQYRAGTWNPPIATADTAGRARRAPSGPPSVPSSLLTEQTNLEYLPGPVTRKRRPRSNGLLGGELTPGMQQVVVNAQMLLLLLLLGAVIYGVMVSNRVSRSHSSLTDSNASLPPATAKLVRHLADEELGESLAQMEENIAQKVENAAREMMIQKLHETSSEIAHKVEEEIRVKIAAEKAHIEAESAPKAGPSLEEVFDALRVPYDLRFTGMEEFIDHNLRRATQLLEPRKYEGPLDLDDAVDKRANEIEAEWVAKGSPEAERPGYVISAWREMPALPYQIITDWAGKETGVFGVTCPYKDEYYGGEMERGAFWWLKNAGYIAVGISSYEMFPGENTNPVEGRHSTRNPRDKEIFQALDGFLHCSREPDAILPANVPRTMISDSDFVNFETVKPIGAEKKYDFVYVNNGGGDWQDYNRNWTLAKDAIKIMMDMGLKVLTTRDLKDTPELQPFVTTGQLVYRPFGPWNEWIKEVESSRAMFTPCVSDASPRSVSEALALNVPVLMNRHIMGGWKYVNEQTGVLFDDLTDIKAAIEKLRSPEFQAGLSPRQYMEAHYGRWRSALRLYAFLDLTVGEERLKAARAERDKYPVCSRDQPQVC